jgi:hypothetical protein
VRTYESSTSGDQYFHIAEGEKLGGKREECKEEVGEASPLCVALKRYNAGTLHLLTLDNQLFWNGI